MSKGLKGNLMLLTAAFIWGVTFVAQMQGMDNVGPFTFSFSRFVLALLFMLALWQAGQGRRRAARQAGAYKPGWKAGAIAGTSMIIASLLQQYSMLYTSASKAAFITTLYMIIVPIGAVLLGRRIHIWNWIGAVIAITGMYMLSIRGAVTLNFGDVLLFISTFFWAGQILIVDRFATGVDNIELSTAQLFVCMVVSLVFMAIYEEPSWSGIRAAWLPIAFSGILSGGVAFTLQIVGQRYAEPAPAAVLMSCESVFGALASWLVLGDRLTPTQLLGCALLFIACLVTQLGLFIGSGPARGTDLAADDGRSD